MNQYLNDIIDESYCEVSHYSSDLLDEFNLINKINSINALSDVEERARQTVNLTEQFLNEVEAGTFSRNIDAVYDAGDYCSGNAAKSSLFFHILTEKVERIYNETMGKSDSQNSHFFSQKITRKKTLRKKVII